MQNMQQRPCKLAPHPPSGHQVGPFVTKNLNDTGPKRSASPRPIFTTSLGPDVVPKMDATGRQGGGGQEMKGTMQYNKTEEED